MSAPAGLPHPRSGLGEERDRAAAQSPYTVRLGWGESGAAALAPSSDVVVVVDVITFTTAVAVAAERGCAVYPHRWDDGGAARLAESLGIELAVSRSHVDADHPYSLSPETLSRLPLGSAIVLPSPNGAAVSVACATAGALVVAGSLRNAAAAARFARSAGRSISVIAAGERWSDGSLDPALEDLLGAGAIIDGLRRRRRSPEARAAAAAYLRACHQGLRRTLMETVAALELRRRGYQQELEWACALNCSTVVPVLGEGAFRSR